MAAKKVRPPKNNGPKKGLRGRMPVKRSINLILVDENKISVPKATLGIILIVILAGLFGKFMVLDRLNAVSAAASKVTRVKSELAAVEALLEQYGDVEDTYAHYTYADMTDAEQSMVDRVSVLELVGTILPAGETSLDPEEFQTRLVALIGDYCAGSEDVPDMNAFIAQLYQLIRRITPMGYSVQSWTVSGNLLNVEIRGSSLERLNRLARQLEKEAIVNNCAITTARKDGKQIADTNVQARFIVYLQKPKEEVKAQ